jgi:Cu(I)/Ag(I) efflux system membrane protein CusA/SilA
MPDLDEQSIMDMPTTVPRASVLEASKDLAARDEVLRSFPEVYQVVGKAGRAETPTDPAPLDMVETVVNLRGRGLWPKRKLRFEDGLEQTRAVLVALEAEGVLKRPDSPEERDGLANDVTMTVTTHLDEVLRDLAVMRLHEFGPELGRGLIDEAMESLLGRVEPSAVLRRPTADERKTLVESLARRYGDRLALEVLPDDASEFVRDLSRRLISLGVLRNRTDVLSPRPKLLEQAADVAGDVLGFPKPTLFTRITEHLSAEHDRRLKGRTKTLNWELFDRAVEVVTGSAVDELVKLGRERTLLAREPKEGELEGLEAGLRKPFADRLLLWQKTKNDLVAEMSTALQMPGWGNSFTQPIANRIEMLSTGVRLPVAVKVFGSKLDDIQRVSQEIADVLRGIRGAADVFPDQIIGKGYVEITIDREKAARYGIQVGDVQDVVEVAMGGRPLTMTVEGRERYPVRVRYARAYRDDVESLKRILVAGQGMPAGGMAGPGGGMGGGMGAGGPAAAAKGASSDKPVQVPLAEVADVRVVEGPSMIKSENGLLRAYIQLNVRGRDEVGFVEEARRVVQEKVVDVGHLPGGMYLEWSGTFEHQVRAQKTLRIVFPAVIATIMLILYLTHRSWTDAFLMMTSVLGALAGGAIFQWLFGFRFSVAVQVGYIACFGMAVETSVVMLVYLREAIEERGGLERIGSIAELRQAILEGAVHRLRPKLLTEGAAIISIAPMLWATGVGSEVIRPMAAPVLGGLLIADEVIDIFLPVLYFAVQKRRWRKLHGMSLLDELDDAREEALPVAVS